MRPTPVSGGAIVRCRTAGAYAAATAPSVVSALVRMRIAEPDAASTVKCRRQKQQIFVTSLLRFIMTSI